jgi:CheY-like chemotaxis protein
MKTVLLVEDNLVDVTYLTATLEKNFKVITTCNAHEVIRKIIGLECDIIMLDIALPINSGVQILQEIRKISNIPVVIWTAYRDKALKEKCMELGIDDYLEKPIRLTDLVIVFNPYL